VILGKQDLRYILTGFDMLIAIPAQVPIANRLQTDGISITPNIFLDDSLVQALVFKLVIMQQSTDTVTGPGLAREQNTVTF
jgi:hypothetical protein